MRRHVAVITTALVIAASAATVAIVPAASAPTREAATSTVSRDGPRVPTSQ
jgi:hypothetical protein